MDLALLEQQDTGTLELSHPDTGRALGVFFVLASPEHDLRRDWQFKQQRQTRKQFEKAGRISLGDPEDEEDDVLEYISLSVLSWYDGTPDKTVLTIGGETLPFSKANVLALVSQKRFGWIKRQIRAGLDRDSLFMKSSSAA